MSYGIITLLPPLLVIFLAIRTRSTTSSLFIGSLVCCIIHYGTHFLGGFIDLMYSVGTNPDTVWYVLFVSFFGCILGIWSSFGSTRALADWLKNYCTSARKTTFFTWLLGGLVFVDDFASVVVTSSMASLYDKHKIPRAMLAYIADSTASPICTIIPFGTWAIFYQSVFAGYEEVATLGSSMATYTKAIPYMFYGWAALIVTLLAALNIIRPLGAMKKAYKRVQTTGEVYGPESMESYGSAAVLAREKNKSNRVLIWGFVLPLLVFLGVILFTGDVLIASLLTISIMIPYYILFHIATWKQLMKACMAGIGDIISMVTIVFAAYMLRDSLVAIGMPSYVISVAKPIISPAFLPAITFGICTILTFASGSNWGATLPVTAIVIPLAAATGANIYLVIAAIVSGAAFGAHACFFCDVTIFTSGMCKIDNMEHAITQLPYCLISASVSLVAFLVAGIILK